MGNALQIMRCRHHLHDRAPPPLRRSHPLQGTASPAQIRVCIFEINLSTWKQPRNTTFRHLRLHAGRRYHNKMLPASKRADVPRLLNRSVFRAHTAEPNCLNRLVYPIIIWGVTNLSIRTRYSLTPCYHGLDVGDELMREQQRTCCLGGSMVS